MDLEKIRNEVGTEIKKLQRVFEAAVSPLSKAARAKIAEAQRER
jgi:hypothetical protein